MKPTLSKRLPPPEYLVAGALAAALLVAALFPSLRTLAEEEGTGDAAGRSAASEIARGMQRAADHWSAGRLTEAEQEYRRVLAFDPEHYEALRYLGDTLYRQGRHALAVDPYRRALEQRRDPEVAYWLGMSLLEVGREAEAREAFEEVLAIDPDHREARERLDELAGR